jgi:hypothetical protein
MMNTALNLVLAIQGQPRQVTHDFNSDRSLVIKHPWSHKFADIDSLFKPYFDDGMPLNHPKAGAIRLAKASLEPIMERVPMTTHRVVLPFPVVTDPIIAESVQVADDGLEPSYYFLELQAKEQKFVKEARPEKMVKVIRES